MGATRSPLYSRKQPGGMFSVEDVPDHPGDVYWVCSVTGTDAAGYGYGPDAPLATIDYAISNRVTANKQDVVYVMPGHAENITAATTLVADVAGMSIIGLGTGADRPTLTVKTNATASVVISAASVTLKNFLFVCGTDGINAGVTLSGADAIIEGCEFRDPDDVEADIWVSASGARPTFRDCFFNGFITGNQQEAAIDLNAVNGALIEGCRFYGKAITACVNMSVACTNLTVRNCEFLVTSTTDFSKTVVDTATGSTWLVTECFDLGAGSKFYGGSGAALAAGTATIGAGAITAASFGAGAIDAAAIKDAAIDAATFAADCAAYFEGEAEDALEGENLDHFSKVAVDTNLQTTVHDNSALGYVLASANVSNFDRTTDSLEAIGANVASVLDDTGTTGVAVKTGGITAAVVATGAIDNDAIASDTILGANDNNNAFDSSTVTANRDGSIVERLEHLLDVLVDDETTNYIGVNDADNAATTNSVVANADGSILERLEYVQTETDKIDGATLDAAPVAGSLARFVASGGTALGTPLADSKSLVDALGTNGTTLVDSATSVVGILGVNDADNLFTSNSVVANADGSVLERLEYIQAEADKISSATLQAAPTAGSLARYVASGGTALGTPLADSKSLVDALGTNGTTLVDSATSIVGILGVNDADNAFDSGTVAANVDGSILERLEYIQANATPQTPATYVPGLGYRVTKTEDASDDTTGDDLFDVTGKVLLTLWTGEVNGAALGAGITDYKIRVKTANTDLCAASNIATAVVGYMFQLSGDAGDTVLGTPALTDDYVADLNAANPMRMVVGLAGGTCTLQSLHTDSGAGSGNIKHVLFYLPLEASAAVVTSAT